MDHPFAGTELETFLASGIENLLLYIKKTPNNTIIADLLIYAAIVYGILLLVRCTSKVRWCKKITHFLFPRGIMQFLLNLVQTLSIIITIVFSNNIMNILKLEEAEKKLGAVQKKLEDKKKERDEIQQELEDNKKMLEMKTREYNKVQAVSRELARTNRGIEEALYVEVVRACFFHISLKVNEYYIKNFVELFFLLRDEIYKRGTAGEREIAGRAYIEKTKRSFNKKTATILVEIVDSLQEKEMDEKYKSIYTLIRWHIQNDQTLQSPFIDFTRVMQPNISEEELFSYGVNQRKKLRRSLENLEVYLELQYKRGQGK